VGYAVGAFALRLNRVPRSLARAVPVWLLTLVLGMALRTVQKGRAPDPAFIIVATLALALGLLGWRVVAAIVCRRRAARAQAAAAE
jgi:hypothetical protein